MLGLQRVKRNLESVPCVTERNMRDEQRRHRTDPQNLPDRGLQVGQTASVTKLGGPVDSDLYVHLILDTALHLKKVNWGLKSHLLKYYSTSIPSVEPSEDCGYIQAFNASNV